MHRLGPATVSGRPLALERAVTNLVENALKFDPRRAADRGHLRGRPGGVADRGPGDRRPTGPCSTGSTRSTDARSRRVPGLGLSPSSPRWSRPRRSDLRRRAPPGRSGGRLRCCRSGLVSGTGRETPWSVGRRRSVAGWRRTVTRGRLELDISVAVITNDNPTSTTRSTTPWTPRCSTSSLRAVRPDIRAVVWRGEGKSWSSGRDDRSIGINNTDMTHHELMTRGIRGIQRLWDLEAPIIVAIHGWALGGSFQRALLCDIRIASDDALHAARGRPRVIPTPAACRSLYDAVTAWGPTWC